MLNGPRSRILVEGIRASIILLGLLAVPLAAAYLIGTRLPEEHTATASAIIQAPPSRVWELITDFSSETNWRKGPLILVRGPNRRAATEPCWMEGWLLLKMTLCSVDDEQNHKRVVDTIGTGLPFDATWTYDLSPDGPSGAETRLSITEHSIIDPPLWRLIGRYILRQNTSVSQYVRDLQAEALRRP